MNLLLSLFLLTQQPQMLAQPKRPVRQPTGIADLLRYHAGCTADLAKANEFIAEQEQYINQLEAENAELKKAQKNETPKPVKPAGQ